MSLYYLAGKSFLALKRSNARGNKSYEVVEYNLTNKKYCLNNSAQVIVENSTSVETNLP